MYCINPKPKPLNPKPCPLESDQTLNLKPFGHTADAGYNNHRRDCLPAAHHRPSGGNGDLEGNALGDCGIFRSKSYANHLTQMFFVK